MSIADIDIVNLALTMLGEQRVLSLTTNTKAARSANAIYEIQRDNELRAHQWNFATKRAQLPALVTPPAYGFKLAYQLPADYLAVIQVGDVYPGSQRILGMVVESQTDYQIEGQQILTNIGYNYQPVVTSTGPGPLCLRYTSRVTNPNLFDVCFVAAFACRMAMKLCEDLTQDAGKRNLAMKEYQEAITVAIRANAIERAPEMLPQNSWLMSRYPG